MDKKKLIRHLQGFITEERNALFERILEQRTRYLAVVLEDIYQPHNASAVLRSMDCFGIQDAHIIENANAYRINPDVALGASKWLTLLRYNQASSNTREAIGYLREQGYRIVATTPHEHDVPLRDFNLKKGKSALLFGTEMRGLSREALDMSDEYLRIPMYGFTESFNISVSAAIILYQLKEKLMEEGIHCQLTPEEKMDLHFEWLKKSIKRSDLIIREFLSQ